MNEEEAKKLTAEEKEAEEIAKLRYRFNGTRYSFVGPAHYLDNQVVYELPSLMTFPKKDQQKPV